VPKALEDKLRKEADAKGLTGERKDAYIFGTMRKTGWVPSTQKHPKGHGMLADYVNRKKEKK